MLRKIFFGILILFVLLIAAAVALPLIFKDDLIAAVKEQVNETVNAKVDFSDVNISLFRHFPKLSFGLENLKVEGVEAFEGVPLLQTDRLDLALDFWSVIGGGNLKIKGLHLEKPVVNVHILKDGKANYDITKPSPPTKEEEPSDFLIQLESYSIKDGTLVYDDRSMDLYAEAKNLNHSGSGNLTADVYDLDTKTSIESLTTTFDGITYLNKVNTKLNAVVNADMKNMKFTLKDNDLLLNALQIITNGWVQLKEEDIDMDLTFNAPSNNFKDLLSLVPGAFTQGYENVKASGTFALNAEVKGTYNGAKEQLPAFKINAKIENGDVKYPDLPVGISAIFALVNVDSPASDFNQMKLDVSRFSLKIGGNPFEGFFKLKTPVSDPDVDAKMKGTINLGDLAKAFPVAGTEAMNGIVSADMTLKAKMSDVDAGRYEQVQANGFFNIADMLYDAVDMPPVKINELKTTLTPKNLTISSFDGKLGKSDLRASGSIDNVLAYFSTDKTMRGDLTLRSDLFDANEWLAEENAAEPQPVAPEQPQASGEVFDRFDFSLDAQVGMINYDTYKLTNTIAKGSFTPNKLNINEFSTKIGKSDLRATGVVNNAFNYVFKNETLFGNIDLAGNLLDLNEFMTAEPAASGTTAAAATEPILVPEKIDMTVNADLDRVLYTNMDLRDVRGALKVKDEAVKLENVQAAALGGEVTLTGGYDTKDHEKPTFSLKMDLLKLNFGEAFQTFNTFQKLAPIGQFMNGKFTTSLAMNGILGKDLSPDLSTLTVDGFFETLNGVLSNFKPTEKIANLLNINEFKNMQVKDLKTWFEVKEGRVEVKEFPVSWNNIDMKIGGSHGLDQDMNYTIATKIPRKLLEKTQLTSAANSGLNLLNKEASKLGMNLNAGEFINVGLNILGTIADPKVNVKLLGTDGKALDVVETVKEEVKEKVEEKIGEVKENVQEEVDKQKEELRKKADAEIQNLMKQAEATAQKIRDEGKSAAEQARKVGYEQADKLEKEAGNNPLKKAGAKVAADKIRKETDKKATQIQNEANAKADAVLQKAREESEKVKTKYGI